MGYRRTLLGGVLICLAGVILWVVFGSPARSSDEDLLDLIYAGSKNAVSAIHSGKGRVVVRESSILAKGAPEAVQEMESVYELIFVGDRYRLSIDQNVLKRDLIPGEKYPPGSQQMTGARTKSDISINGKRITEFVPDKKIATISDVSKQASLSSLHSTLMRTFGDLGRYLMPSKGLVDIGSYVKRVPPESHPDARMIGREIVDGTECIVTQLSSSPTAGGMIVYVLWVSPERGFTVLRVRKYAQPPGSSERILTDEENVAVKDYGSGTWYPKEITRKYYRHDDQGAPYVSASTVITYDRSFHINTDVAEDDLSLNLLPGTQVHDETLDADYTVP